MKQTGWFDNSRSCSPPAANASISSPGSQAARPLFTCEGKLFREQRFAMP
jgi:hypothetical protein